MGKVQHYKFDNYFKKEYFFFGDDNGNQTELPAGDHDFSISHQLPPRIPTSFKCALGKIRYEVRIILCQPWKLKKNFNFPYTIIRPLDLNLGSYLRNALTYDKSKMFKMDCSGLPLTMEAIIPYSGYVPGQSICVKIEVVNLSNTRVKEVSVYLKLNAFLTDDQYNNHKLRSHFAKVSMEPVEIKTTKFFRKEIVVPNLPPTISNCACIKVTYSLVIKAVTCGMSRSPKISFPIVIGTKSLDNIVISPSFQTFSKKLFFCLLSINI